MTIPTEHHPSNHRKETAMTINDLPLDLEPNEELLPDGFPASEPEPAPAVIARLRALADWLEARPDFARKQSLLGKTVWFNAYSAEEFGTLAAQFGQGVKGVAEATEWTPDQLTLTTTVEDAELVLKVTRADVCERVQVGTRKVVRKVYPTTIQPAEIEVTEPVYEWSCPPSFLALGEQ